MDYTKNYIGLKQGKRIMTNLTENAVAGIFKSDRLTESVLDVLNEKVEGVDNKMFKALKKNELQWANLDASQKAAFKELDLKKKVQYRYGGKWWTPESEISWNADTVYRVI